LESFGEMLDLIFPSRTETHTGDCWFALKDCVAEIRDHNTRDTGVLGGLIGAFKLREILSSKSNFDTMVGLVERDGFGTHLFCFEKCI